MYLVNEYVKSLFSLCSFVHDNTIDFEHNNYCNVYSQNLVKKQRLFFKLDKQLKYMMGTINREMGGDTELNKVCAPCYTGSILFLQSFIF